MKIYLLGAVSIILASSSYAQSNFVRQTNVQQIQQGLQNLLEQRQQLNNCPTGTEVAVFVAVDPSRNKFSIDFQSYCKELQSQRLSYCPEGTEPTSYEVFDRDRDSNNLFSTGFLPGCKNL